MSKVTKAEILDRAKGQLDDLVELVSQLIKIPTINEQILKFAQNYPTSFKTASSDAPFFMNWCRLPIRSVLT